ncbi:MAG: glucuronate isomerase [Spirochaetia bacterium]|nr:glucuronate isomerase [Spirochaetia bacterium]
MKTFITDDFMLQNDTARELYHSYAKEMPIFDFHCHLPPKEIAENSRYSSITDVWLGSDHYKWRAMRSDGVDERVVTGNGDDWEKFKAWAATLQHAVGNPLYHWSHMELLRYFGIDEVLTPESAPRIYEEANRQLQQDEFRVQPLLTKMKVKAVCTTDDPADSLEHHQAIAGLNSAGSKGDKSSVGGKGGVGGNLAGGFDTTVVPTFRPDKALAIDDPQAFRSYLETLGRSANLEIKSYRDLIDALDSRHAFFHSIGGRVSDHALVAPFAEESSEAELARIFAKVRSGENADRYETLQFKTAVLREIGRMNYRRGWTMQLHIGAQRNNNSRMFRALGPDTGFDSMADVLIAAPLARFLDLLDSEQHLPKTIIYVLNPRDNDLVASIIGAFQDGSVPGKIQFGSGWWFNDHKDGMERQMIALANMGLLYRFVGMLTDSRSFLSFPRHEYFRRILCNVVGDWVERGEAPKDMEFLGKMVQKISYQNAEDYFGIATSH